MSSTDADNKRSTLRQAVLKGAQIIAGQTVIDCLVLDVSEAGARVRTAAVSPVPEQVQLHFRGGAIYPAARRWTRGTEIGFSFVRTSSLAEEPARVAWRIYEMVRVCTLEEPLRLLNAHQSFDDVALRLAAEEAEAAIRRLEAALAKRARGTG